MQDTADWLDIRSSDYGATAVVLFKTAFFGHFDLKNSKTRLICYLLYIFTLSMYSALGLTTNKCSSKGLSEKLSPAQNIELLSESAGKSSGVSIWQTPLQTAVMAAGIPTLKCRSTHEIVGPPRLHYPTLLLSILSIDCPFLLMVRFINGRSIKPVFCGARTSIVPNFIHVTPFLSLVIVLLPYPMLFICLILFCLTLTVSEGKLINVTIDDAQRGLQNGTLLTYTGDGNWNANSYPGSPCPNCIYHPAQANLMNSTWHDGSAKSGERADVNVSFTGMS